MHAFTIRSSISSEVTAAARLIQYKYCRFDVNCRPTDLMAVVYEGASVIDCVIRKDDNIK